MIGIFMALVGANAPVALWQNVTAGMSFNQLKAAQPSTIPIPADQKRHYMGTCSYRSDPVTIVSEPYDVCYEVGDNGVTAVILHGAKESASPVAFTLLKPALAARYGQPVLDDCSPIPAGRMCKAIWKKDGVVITATGTTIVGLNSVGVTYEADKAGADPL